MVWNDEGGDVQARGLVNRHARRPRGSDTLLYQVVQRTPQKALSRRLESHGIPGVDGLGSLMNGTAGYRFPLPPPSAQNYLTKHIHALPPRALAEDQDQQRHRAAQPRDPQANPRGGHLPGRKERPHARDREAEVRHRE